jgi:hypothetical protein
MEKCPCFEKLIITYETEKIGKEKRRNKSGRRRETNGNIRKEKGKSVPLHATKVLAGRVIAPTHSRPRY